MYKPFIYTFLLALGMAGTAKAQTVTLDYYFNHEVHKGANGQLERYHYLWTDRSNAGFAIWGDIFKKEGARLDTLSAAPTVSNLKGADIYIIVDPDNAKESANPHYIQAGDVKQIAAWVKAGGVLVLMANDSANVELPHFNTLAAAFGLHFNNDLQNHVIDDAHFNDGSAVITDKQLFKSTQKVFLKDVCSIDTKASAKTVLTSPVGAAIAVVSTYGKGTVFAVGDPWLYNEYVNGRLPADFENNKAAADLAQWLLKQTHKKH